MKRYWIEHQDTRPVCPMTFWVHREAAGEPRWYEAERFEPPRPGPAPGKGYAVLHVECGGFVFEFASLAELAECVRVLGRKLLPRAADLARERHSDLGPNSHWLSRLPARAKPWAYRKAAVRFLQVVADELSRRGWAGTPGNDG